LDFSANQNGANRRAVAFGDLEGQRGEQVLPGVDAQQVDSLQNGDSGAEKNAMHRVILVPEAVGAEVIDSDHPHAELQALGCGLSADVDVVFQKTLRVPALGRRPSSSTAAARVTQFPE